MIFLPVGTQFGFDRLVKAIDKAILKKIIVDEVFAQIGPGTYKPTSMKYVINLGKEEFDHVFHSCDAIISHAGMGNIALAMKTQKPLLVLPRLKKYGEVVNNHQVDTARKFEELGHILAAYDENELMEKIKLLKTFVPKPRIPNRQGVIDRIASFLDSLENTK
ncbi:MAG TPA: glycosyltransferase [Anaerohalosphaeraceae bacterium]|nr:glycosyltransferase [Anaerohalosphaeraceae bacterium]